MIIYYYKLIIGRNTLKEEGLGVFYLTVFWSTLEHSMAQISVRFAYVNAHPLKKHYSLEKKKNRDRTHV